MDSSSSNTTSSVPVIIINLASPIIDSPPVITNQTSSMIDSLSDTNEGTEEVSPFLPSTLVVGEVVVNDDLQDAEPLFGFPLSPTTTEQAIDDVDVTNTLAATSSEVNSASGDTSTTNETVIIDEQAFPEELEQETEGNEISVNTTEAAAPIVVSTPPPNETTSEIPAMIIGDEDSIAEAPITSTAPIANESLSDMSVQVIDDGEGQGVNSTEDEFPEALVISMVPLTNETDIAQPPGEAPNVDDTFEEVSIPQSINETDSSSIPMIDIPAFPTSPRDTDVGTMLNTTTPPTDEQVATTPPMQEEAVTSPIDDSNSTPGTIEAVDSMVSSNATTTDGESEAISPTGNDPSFTSGGVAVTDSMCVSHDACAAMEGACCPMAPDSAVFLACCGTGLIIDTCRDNPRCAELGFEVGEACCPTASGVFLDCCDVVPDECGQSDSQCVLESASNYRASLGNHENTEVPSTSSSNTGSKLVALVALLTAVVVGEFA